MHEAPILIYTIHGCPYCKSAVQLLRQLRLPFRAVNIGSNADLMLKLANDTGSPTVPKIFVNGAFLGGFTELEAAVSDGSLEKALRSAQRGP